MAKYIKSYSNYVIKKQHQLTNNGTIYERDITTIGGLNQFAKGQKPIYQSGNFIITVREDYSGSKQYTNNRWVKNNESEVWTLSNLSAITESTDDTLNIVLKQDYYKLRDFAYYGSCSELIRGSLNDIVSRFPGELYVSSFTDISYTKEDKTEGSIKGGHLLDNPFNINIHTEKVNHNESYDSLKYFCNNGYKNYEIIRDGSDEPEEITTWQSNCDDSCKKLGDNVGTVQINSITINVYKLTHDSVVYFTNSPEGIHIRPKKKFYAKFFKSLDAFQRVILNKDSKPQYSALFEVTNENEYGYYTELKRFTFPLSHGKYNLAVNNRAYAAYLESLVEVAEFYDTIFCDNMYRMMTHEAIKNFDWTFSKEYEVSEEEAFILGGNKIQKALRLFGREFDEIKYYIDSIANANTLTYNDSSSMPDYFLTDSVINDGWDVTNIYPFVKNDLLGTFSNDIELIVNPYSKEKSQYQDGYFNDNGQIEAVTSTNGKQQKIKKSSKGKQLLNRIKQYSSDRNYTMNQVNNHFLKMLRLNSRNIFSHKGTIEGIEMILSLFGFKSKRWLEGIKNRERLVGNDNHEALLNTDAYDYEIKEYVSYTTGLTDTVNEDRGFYGIDWYNYTKSIAYDTDNYRNGIYQSYQGLPIRYYYDEYECLEKDENGNVTSYPTRYLFPYFNSRSIIDGNPYYQMNGGWLWKTKQFNSDDKQVDSAYTETIKNEHVVDDLKALLSIPVGKLHNNIIYAVNDMSKDYVSVNGVIYPLLKEFYFTSENINQPTQYYEYFTVETTANQVIIGNNVYLDALYVSDPHGKENNVRLHSLSDYPIGTEIRIYVVKDGEGDDAKDTIYCYESMFQDNPMKLDIVFVRNGIVEGQSEELTIENKTNYFILQDINYKYQIGGNGWKQLTIDDEPYKALQNAENYFNGNNPHVGNNQYDDGREYLNYFIQIFKHAAENKLFDKKCYYQNGINFEHELNEKISTIGFTDILTEVNGETEGETIEKIVEIADNKIEYFGNFIRKEDGKYVDWIYNIFPEQNCEEKEDTNDKEEESIIEESYNLSNTDIYFKEWTERPISQTEDGRQYGSTDQIINTKRVDIIFNLNAEQVENDALIKFMDDVVLKYMTQMIPSNTILHIIYEKRETE